ncbi:MAG: calcium-binding protein, partial [Janthinobacterium lividum]
TMLDDNLENLNLLDFSKPEQGIADGVAILVYGYPKAFELDYMQGNAVPGFKGTCALTAIANLSIQAKQELSEAQVVQTAIANNWCVVDPAKTDYERGASDYAGQQALLTSYGIRNGIVMGYDEQAIANLIKGGRGVILGINCGKLWDDADYLDHGGVNHVVTVTGVAADASTGAINGFYIADSGRGKVSDMTRYVTVADFRNDANIAGAYAIYTIEPIKLWEENIDATGNELDNLINGNRGDNILAGARGNDTVAGGMGNDTYVFHRGDGQDTIIDKDGTSGNRDVLQLVGIDSTDLRFRHVNDDLLINVQGSYDQITLKDWYLPGESGTDNQIESIQTSAGMAVSNNQVDLLIQAMAAFAPPAMALTNWTSMQNDRPQIMLTTPH